MVVKEIADLFEDKGSKLWTTESSLKEMYMAYRGKVVMQDYDFVRGDSVVKILKRKEDNILDAINAEATGVEIITRSYHFR